MTIAYEPCLAGFHHIIKESDDYHAIVKFHDIRASHEAISFSSQLGNHKASRL
jgi:hypothetical protein